jgi:hypothetical protein
VKQKALAEHGALFRLFPIAWASRAKLTERAILVADGGASRSPPVASDDDVGPSAIAAVPQTAGPAGTCSGTDIVSASRS